VWEVGTKKEKELDLATTLDLAICNTLFQKKKEVILTYKSSGRESQIDFILCRRQYLKEIKDCKIINSESMAPQHGVVNVNWEFVIRNSRRSRNG